MQYNHAVPAGVKQSPLKMPLSSISFSTQAEHVSESSGIDCGSPVSTLLLGVRPDVLDMPQADPQTMLVASAGPGRAERRPSSRKLAHWLMAVSMLVCLAGVGWQALGPGAGTKGQPIYQGGLASGHTRQAARSGWQSVKKAGLLTQAFQASQQAAEAARETFCNGQQQLAAASAGLKAQALQVKTSAPCSGI